MDAVTDTDEGRYPDAVGSLVAASKDVARLTRERDEARAQVDRVRMLADDARRSSGGPYVATVDVLSLERALDGAS